MSNVVSERMRSTWDSLARRNAAHYIATDKQDWDIDTFLRVGKERLHALLERLGARPADYGGALVDLGCGIGRFSFAFADLFDHVLGVDVSDEMIRRANALKAERGYHNVEFRRNDGTDLSFLPSESHDFAFSYTVLQHIPDKRIVFGYILELARVVRPGGRVLFQVLTYRERPLAQFVRLGSPVLYRALWHAERQGLLPPDQGAAFHGSRLTLRELEEQVSAAGLKIAAVDRRRGRHRMCDETTLLCRKRAS
jgi:2-polyprenyl-3-methyl-5-hydroxy-6-metoxy-1,4-benzoquinol methylase